MPAVGNPVVSGQTLAASLCRRVNSLEKLPRPATDQHGGARARQFYSNNQWRSLSTFAPATFLLQVGVSTRVTPRISIRLSASSHDEATAPNALLTAMRGDMIDSTFSDRR